MSHLFPPPLGGDQLTVNVALADGPGNKHAILGTEVDDDDGFRWPGALLGQGLDGRSTALASDLQIRGYF
jgi:hypothetical protein